MRTTIDIVRRSSFVAEDEQQAGSYEPLALTIVDTLPGSSDGTAERSDLEPNENPDRGRAD